MLRLCLLHRCMPIGAACRALGFQTPPTNKRELKKRFIQLTKENHPDLHADNEKAATERMVQLTQAYACLKKVLEHGVHYQRSSSSKAAAASSSSAAAAAQGGSKTAEAEWEEVTATFRAPGSSISLRGFTLPWQRASSSTATASLEAKLQEPAVSFADFVRFARQLDKDRQRREERRQEDAAAADGSHGYTAEYFETTRKNSDARRGRTASSHPRHIVALGLFYYGRRLRRRVAEAPRNAWNTIRYVFLGH